MMTSFCLSHAYLMTFLMTAEDQFLILSPMEWFLIKIQEKKFLITYRQL